MWETCLSSFRKQSKLWPDERSARSFSGEMYRDDFSLQLPKALGGWVCARWFDVPKSEKDGWYKNLFKIMFEYLLGKRMCFYQQGSIFLRALRHSKWFLLVCHFNSTLSYDFYQKHITDQMRSENITEDTWDIPRETVDFSIWSCPFSSTASDFCEHLYVSDDY